MNNLTPIFTEHTDFPDVVADFYADVRSVVHSEISGMLSTADTHREAQCFLQYYMECHLFSEDEKPIWHDYESGFSVVEPITLTTSVGTEEAGLTCEIVFQFSAEVSENDFVLWVNIRNITLVR